MLERGERFDWFESRFVTSLAVTALVAGIALIWRELTVDEPIIDFSVLKSRQLATGVAMAAALGLALYGGVFVLPIFLQGLHGFTAQQTGMVILPGAIASAITMAIMGRMRSKIDARYTIAAGSLIFLLSMWQLSTLTIDSGQNDLFWPLVLRGFGLGLIFIPLTNASMADLPMKDIAQGTGMFNLMRQLGGSLGIAVMATLLGRYTKGAKAVLTEHIGSYDPATLGRLDAITHGMMAKGMTALQAKQQAVMILDRQLTAQASVLAFGKLYLLNGIVLVLALPLLFLWKTGRGREGMSGSAH
jgi:DHA2 family multidrug resistance protein